MKILVTGSREWPSTVKGLEAIFSILQKYDEDNAMNWHYEEMELISGMSDQGGVDIYCAAFAVALGWKLDPCPAEVSEGRTRPQGWQYARRNKLMVAKLPDLVLAFYVKGAGNRGTQMTVDFAKEAGIPIRSFWFDPITETMEEK